MSLNEQIIFRGYASNYLPDKHKHCVCKKAFNKIEPNLIGMYWEHNNNLRIGEWLQIYDDDFGLYVVGRLDLKKIVNQNLNYYIRKNINNIGLSVGMYAKKSKEENGIRYILEAELVEISLTFHPVNQYASVVASGVLL